MLQIVIVKSYANGNLEFTENGSASNGNSSAVKGEPVHWKIHPDAGVAYIDDINMKGGPSAPPSRNIFSDNPIKPQGTRTHWKGTVNNGAQPGDEYNYYIKWKSKSGGPIKTCDPKITIKPSGGLPFGVIGGLVALFMGAAYMVFVRRKNLRAKQAATATRREGESPSQSQ